MTGKIDYQRIVEEIQTVVTSEALTSESALSELAADYLAACEEANRRLRECAELLQKGLRGEAIQRCEVEPNLLDLTAVLDFPERAVWCDWLRQTERPVPPALSLDVAADLNAAYAEEQPLANLMERHRTLALVRAPIRLRIAVLRQIAAADAGNPIWSDDLRLYEEQRLKQLRAEIDAAQKASDIGGLVALEKELRDIAWVETPAPALLERVVKAAARLRAKQARAEMQQLEPLLTGAFSDFDVERARPLRSRWKACQMLAGLPSGDPLLERAAPAIEWLEEQDRRDQANAEHAQALADLERALDGNQSRVELDRLYHRLISCDRGVPEVIERRFRDRVTSLSLAESRRNKLRVASLSVAAIAAAAGLWLFIGRQLRETEAADAAHSLQALLDESKTAEAQQFFDGIMRDRAWLDERTEIQELRSRLDGMVKAESDRRAAFVTALASARAAGVDRPDDALLDEARRLAATSKEKADVLKFEREIAHRRREMQDERNAAFNARVQELGKRIETLEKGDGDDHEKRLEAIRLLVGEAEALTAGKAGGADAALVNNAKLLRTRLRTLEETARDEIDRRRYMHEINASVGDWSQFRKRLGDYIDRFPGGKRASDFQRVIDASPSLEDQIEKWNELTAAFSQQEIKRVSLPEAVAQLAAAKALANDWRDAPQAPLIQARTAALEAITRRVESGGQRIDAPLKEWFTLPWINGLKIVKTAKKGAYYVEDDPTPLGQGSLKIDFIKDFRLAKGIAYVKQGDLAGEKSIAASPQSVVAQEALGALQKLEDGNWETTFCQIALAVHENVDFDPVLKAQTLWQVLSAGCRGSIPLEHAFAKHLQQLKDSIPKDTVNWLDPTDKEAIRARAAADDLVRRLPDFRAAQEAAFKELELLCQPWPATQYRWVGWLMQGEDGRWKCSSKPLPEDWSADLVLIERADQSPTIEVAKVGRMEKGRAVLAEASPLLLEGRPVYAAFVENGGRGQ